ncbi:MAG: recombination mediator RecR [Candidatus Asgardarchaeia archaeon]
MYPKSIQKLIELFSKFPTVGPRTAARFVFYLIKLNQEKFDELLNSITDLRKVIKICSFCFNPFDASTSSAQDIPETLCSICRNNSRDRTLLCIIEKEIDLISIEKTKKYKGLYFILGGTINLKKNDNSKMRIEELKQRIKDKDFKEIIIATNPTTEGEATALYIERELKLFNIKTTRLGRGLPVGGELEYADEETLFSAFEGRK